jgi:hypothetical protein
VVRGQATLVEDLGRYVGMAWRWGRRLEGKRMDAADAGGGVVRLRFCGIFCRRFSPEAAMPSISPSLHDVHSASWFELALRFLHHHRHLGKTSPGTVSYSPEAKIEEKPKVRNERGNRRGRHDRMTIWPGCASSVHKIRHIDLVNSGSFVCAFPTTQSDNAFAFSVYSIDPDHGRINNKGAALDPGFGFGAYMQPGYETNIHDVLW